MSKYDVLLSPMQRQFKQAAKELCGQTENVGQKEQSVKQSVAQKELKNFKSFAQVESCVGQSIVRQNSCELKLKGRRIHRVTTRFTYEEKIRLIENAKVSQLKLSDYIRASVLGAGYVSAIDPAKRQLLINIQGELNKQGSNLNQIAKHLNAGILNPLQGKDTLSLLARSLLNTHSSVRQALTEGRRAE